MVTHSVGDVPPSLIIRATIDLGKLELERAGDPPLLKSREYAQKTPHFQFRVGVLRGILHVSHPNFAVNEGAIPRLDLTGFILVLSGTWLTCNRSTSSRAVLVVDGNRLAVNERSGKEKGLMDQPCAQSLVAENSSLGDAEELSSIAVPDRRLQARRLRYAATACKECKRRKVRCSGETPCHHCKRYEVQCLYTKKKHVQSERVLEVEEMKQQLALLQQQVSLLVSRDGLPGQKLNDRAAPLKAGYGVSTMKPAAACVVDESPMHSESLQDGGSKRATYLQPTLAAALPVLDLKHGAPANPASFAGRSLPVACHPLLSFIQGEALRLIDIYEDECGSVYPLIDIERLRSFTVHFYRDVAAARHPASWRPVNMDQSSDRPLNTLEIVLAIALVIESGGTTHLSSALVDELEAEIDHRPSGVSADIPLMEILTLMSLYQFYRDEEVLAWRTIGLAARIALEVGLHLRDPPLAAFHSAQERERANRLFWCIYCLDRRWSFGTGLPFGIQEEDIESSLPEPHDSHPHLFTSMIAYSRIGYRILKASSAGKTEESAFLTYQVQQWYSSLEPELRVDHNQDLVLEALSSARNRLRVLNCLRKNQLQMLIHRTPLFTPASIAADPCSARTAVDLAKSTITLLNQLCETSQIYSSHVACFNYFLYSALTVILLATYQRKAEFHEYCRKEFQLGLNLIGGVPAKSNVARKLWKIIKHLKVVGPDTGILPYMETQSQQNLPRQERNERPNFEVSDAANPQVQAQARAQAQVIDNELRANPSLPTFSSNRTLASIAQPIMAYDETNLFAADYALNGSLLSSELSDLFQAIEPTRFDQIQTSQSLWSKGWIQPPPLQAAQSFLSNSRSVF